MNRANRTRRRGAHDKKPRQPTPCAVVGLPKKRGELGPKKRPRVEAYAGDIYHALRFLILSLMASSKSSLTRFR